MNQSEWDQNFAVNIESENERKLNTMKLDKIKDSYCEILLDVIKFHHILLSFV